MQLKSFIGKHSPTVVFHVLPRASEKGALEKVQLTLTMHISPKTGLSELEEDVERLHEASLKPLFWKPSYISKDAGKVVVVFSAPGIPNEKADEWYQRLSEGLHREYHKGVSAQFIPSERGSYRFRLPNALNARVFSRIIRRHNAEVFLIAEIAGAKMEKEPDVDVKIELNFPKIYSDEFLKKIAGDFERNHVWSTHLHHAKTQEGPTLVLQGKKSSGQLRSLYKLFELVSKRHYSREAVAHFVPKK